MLLLDIEDLQTLPEESAETAERMMYFCAALPNDRAAVTFTDFDDLCSI